MKTDLLIFDCSNLCYMAMHTTGILSHNGEDTGVIFGFLKQILKHAKKYKPKNYVFCWDSGSAHGVRKLKYSYYKERDDQNKSQQEEMELRSLHFQMRAMRKTLMPRLGFRNLFYQNGYEADDLIASTVMAYLPLDNTRNVVVSSDDDLLQLLGYCDIYNPNRKEEVDLKAFQEKYGLSDPKAWAEVKTLAGCTSDKVPGLPGVGEKTAIQYLTGTLNPKNKTYAKIVSPANKKFIEQYRWLVALPLEGTETFTVEDFDGMDMNAFKSMCKEYGFKSFLSPSTLDEWEVFFT